MDNVETDKVPHTQTDKVPQTGEASKNSEQPPEATQKSKKRKDLEHKSLTWEHFEEIRNTAGVVIKVRYIYYAKKINAHSKIHGTSYIRNHVLTCLKNPHDKNTRQKLLTLQPVNMVEAESKDALGSLGTWKFDQEAITKCV